MLYLKTISVSMRNEHVTLAMELHIHLENRKQSEEMIFFRSFQYCYILLLPRKRL